MTAWDDYLAAARRLDAVRRDAASVVADEVADVEAARSDLAEIRDATARQQERLVAAAKEAGVPVPETTPTPEELAGARDAIGTSGEPEAVRATLRRTDTVLAALDRLLSTVEEPVAGWRRLLDKLPAVPLNVLVYLGFAVITGLVPLVAVSIRMGGLPFLPTIGCALVFPLIGYALAWLAVGRLERTNLGVPVRRTPLVGAAATAATILLLYSGYAVLALAHVL